MHASKRDDESVVGDSLELIKPSFRDSLEGRSRFEKGDRNGYSRDDGWDDRVSLDINHIQESAVDIQRTYRGHLGRRGLYMLTASCNNRASVFNFFPGDFFNTGKGIFRRT